MISINNLSMFFGQKVLFDNVSFQLNPKNRYGIVGANGSGKSTLIKLIQGEIQPERGEINKPSKLRIGNLSQDHFEFENERIIDTVIMGKKTLWNAIKEKQEILDKAEHTIEEGYRLADLEFTISENHGYTAEADAAIMLSGLGIPEKQHYLLLSTLSGGYKLRVLLAQCLFSDPDCLLLDEPTNHLDIIAIVWLEVFLQNFPGIILVVSHDQFFINNVCTHIVDLDYETIKIYKGNYDRFVEAKELERLQRETGIERQEKKKDEMQLFIDRFKASASKAKQAQSRVKMIEKMENLEIKSSSRIAPNFKFEIHRPTGKKIIELNHISKSFGEKQVLRDISISIQRGEKLAVVGANGLGKSTLLKIILGLIPPTEGEFSWGHEINHGYFPQDHHEILKDGTSPYEWLHDQSPRESIGVIRSLLGRMLFRNDDVHKKIDSISGGEAARLIFASLMIKKHNVLILDEPTNHMDLESVQSLSDALVEFPGTIIFVSHYRQLVHKVATSILALKPDSYEYFTGSYHEYLEKQGEDFLNRNPVKTQIKGKGEATPRPYQSKTKKEIINLEKNLSGSESKIKKLENELAEIIKNLENNDLYSHRNSAELKQTLETQKQKSSELSQEMLLWEKLGLEFENKKGGI